MKSFHFLLLSPLICVRWRLEILPAVAAIEPDHVCGLWEGVKVLRLEAEHVVPTEPPPPSPIPQGGLDMLPG